MVGPGSARLPRIPVIDCQACGRRLEVPAGFPEGGDFACAHCGLWMRNVEAARAFRWASLDPYLRRHGASRMNLWGRFANSVVSLAIVLGIAAAHGAMTVPLALALSLPYLAMMLWLTRRRPRPPAVLWMWWLSAGLGAYTVYVWAPLRLVPVWRRLLEGHDRPAGVFGPLLLAMGLVGAWRYRRWARRLPHMRGAPPEA